MAVLGDGFPTHCNRNTGKESAPGINIVHCTMLNKMKWQMRNDLNSDHNPIIKTFREGDFIPEETKEEKPKYRWKKKVD